MGNKKIVYFDKNIFSQLKSGCQSEDVKTKVKSIEILEKIINSKNKFLKVNFQKNYLWVSFCLLVSFYIFGLAF